MEAELKYQGARFARKWNVRRFSGLRRKNERRAAKRKRAPSRGKSFRLDDTAASSNGRKRGDGIVHCFQEISLYLVVKGNEDGAPYVATLRRFLLRIYSAINRAISWFCLSRRPAFDLFGLTKIEG